MEDKLVSFCGTVLKLNCFEFPMKIKPVDADPTPARPMPAVKHQSLLKRLFEKQFPGVRSTAQEAPIGGIGLYQHQKEKEKDGLSGGGGGGELEPSSVCLGKMVRIFLEDTNEKPSTCGRRRCRCFDGNCEDSSDDESDFFFCGRHTYTSASSLSLPDPLEILKSLVPCPTTPEKNVLADTAWIMEGIRKIKNGGCDSLKINKQRRLLVGELIKLGYDSAICLSRGEKTSSFPSGKYEYIDVIFEGEDRVLIDIDFRSQFEIARSTKKYRSLLQMLPPIFVGRPDRIRKIVTVMCEAAKQSLKKKGLHIPPWRKPEYARSKWVAPHRRLPPPGKEGEEKEEEEEEDGSLISVKEYRTDGGLDQRLEKSGEPTEVKEWQPPAIEREPMRINPRGERKILTGLSSIFA